MAFKYNGTHPTEIIYNGTSLNVLNYNGTNVWGKPFVLSINQGTNTTITVNRTSSPNQGANTGVLTSGSLVFYGDILAISVTVASGYNLNSFTVNGNAWTSGNSHTVTANVTVVSSAVASASWKTVWTGSESASSGIYADKTISTYSSIQSGIPTRINAQGKNNSFVSVTNFEIPNPKGSTQIELFKDGAQNSSMQYVYGITNNIIYVRVGGNGFYSRGITITEVQQYY